MSAHYFSHSSIAKKVTIIVTLSLFLGCISQFMFPLSEAHAQIASSTAPRALLYVTNSKSSIASLRAHIDSMDIVAPQTYAASASGKLLGVPSAEILKLAHDAGAQVMPLVVNQGFNQKNVHTFLLNDAAQDRLLAALIKEAQNEGYIGYQYDFEHMLASDKDKYSVFVAKSAGQLHAAGLQFSVAVAPRISDNPSDGGEGSYNSWTGAFDYQALGASADFISVMAYDDSRSVGPVASLPFVQNVIAYTLARVPANKVSLGIPFYAWVWKDAQNTRYSIVGYPMIATLLKNKTYVANAWSDELGVSAVTYKKKGVEYTAWYEDQKSFEKKLALVTSNNLMGFSAWALGLEDSKVWDSIQVAQAPSDGLASR